MNCTLTRLRELLRTCLALRVTAAILLIMGMLGVLFLMAAMNIGELREQRTQHGRLQELLSTIESTAQIACYLGDGQLMEEIAQGLLSNRIVGKVIVRHADEILLEQGRSGASTASTKPLARSIYSPFDASEQTCRIVLLPNAEEIERAVTEASGFIAAALTLQLISIGVCVILVVVYFVTRPITGISHRLHELKAAAGEKIEVPRSNRRDEIGQLAMSVNAMIDHLVCALSEERKLRLQQEVAERRFRSIFENVETGIFELDCAGRVISANPAFKRLFQVPDDADLTEHPVALADLVAEGALTASELFKRLATQTGPLQLEMGLSGSAPSRWVSVLMSRIEEGRLQGVAHDITDRKLATDAAKQLAVTDALTGLGNRLGFEYRLTDAAQRYRQNSDYRAALMVLDLDHFKAINDSSGHMAGDRVLQHVGELLRELVRDGDYVARLGGDEFVVLLDGLGRRELITPIVERFLQRVNQPIEIASDTTARIGGSVGIAVLGLDTESENELVHLADRAMYRAKIAGRNAYQFYEVRSR